MITAEAYLQGFGIFTDEQIADFMAITELRQLKKNEFFAQEGRRCTEVAFISMGIFRSYYSSAKGEEITYCFRFPGDLLAAYSSYITGEASVETLEAISPCQLLVISKTNIQQLMEKHPNWLIFSKIIAEQQFLELEQRVFQFQQNTAAQR